MFKNFSFNILLIALTLTSHSLANLPDLLTTRLISTNGAGVGSILLNESTILNPASAFFFNQSTFLVQKDATSHLNRSSERSSGYPSGSKHLYSISDVSSPLKGGLSLQKQSENGMERLRFASSASSLIGKDTAMGIIYRYTQEEDREDENTFHQAIIGLTHIYNNNLSMGLRIKDPFTSKRYDDSITAGIQYSLIGTVQLILDYETRLLEDFNKENSTKAALQAALTNSIFLRYSQETNTLNKYNAVAWGASWIGPKLSLEYANRTKTYNKDFGDFFKDEQHFESSLSLALVF